MSVVNLIKSNEMVDAEGEYQKSGNCAHGDRKSAVILGR